MCILFTLFSNIKALVKLFYRYLSLTDSSQQTGSWLSKIAKSDSNDVLVYVSNQDTGIQIAIINDTLGGDYQNLRVAMHYCHQKIAQYNLNNDGSILTIRLLLYKGTHNVNNAIYITPSLNLDYEYLNYKLYIR